MRAFETNEDDVHELGARNALKKHEPASQNCCFYVTICTMFFSACFFVVDVSKLHVENQNKSKLNSMRSGSMDKMQIISTKQKKLTVSLQMCNPSAATEP